MGGWVGWWVGVDVGAWVGGWVGGWEGGWVGGGTVGRTAPAHGPASPRAALVVIVGSPRTSPGARSDCGCARALPGFLTSVSVKIFRLFKCVRVDGTYYLVADMRLECYTSTWVRVGILFCVGCL